MTRKTITQTHYLPADAIGLIGRHALLSSAASLLSFAVAVAILKRRFGRGGGDVFAAALFLAVVALFSAACFYLLATQPGYRVFHPLF